MGAITFMSQYMESCMMTCQSTWPGTWPQPARIVTLFGHIGSQKSQYVGRESEYMAMWLLVLPARIDSRVSESIYMPNICTLCTHMAHTLTRCRVLYREWSLSARPCSTTCPWSAGTERGPSGDRAATANHFTLMAACIS